MKAACLLINWKNKINARFFPDRTLCADCVSPRMNTIALPDHFKPTRFGENLVLTLNNTDECLTCSAYQIIFICLLKSTREMLEDSILSSDRWSQTARYFLLNDYSTGARWI